jgi:prepilin-type N-terminal cleavage/methylation domain-containing protein
MTLIELLVVVSILSILTAFTLPNFVRSYVMRASEATTRTNVRTTLLAVESYATTTLGNYPPDVATFRSVLPDTTGFMNPFTRTKELPVDGVANAQGEIGYESISTEKYRVTGYGVDGLIMVLSNGQ